jgi:molybdopterin/thiamine biosynthesis adenylyltransferase
MNISDSGFFEQSNANRQSLWSFCNDGREKAVVALEAATQANPACKISSFPAITRSNSAAFARGCSAVIDATDSPSSRTAVFSGCRRAAVPYIFASARGSRGMLSVFCGQDFEKEFALRHARQRQRPACDHALGPVANAMGCLAAQQAINLVLAKPAILFPKIISFDAFSKMPFAVHNF